MKVQATWIMINLCIGETKIIEAMLNPKYGVADHVSRYLQTNKNDLVELAFWFLGNVIGDSEKLSRRILVEVPNLLPKMVYVSEQATSLSPSLAEVTIWLARNLTLYA